MNQATFWNGEAGERWVREQKRLDYVLGPLGEEGLAAARVVAGERVLDVGCGCGATALALADAVGPGGEVVGVDLSAPMLAQARARASALEAGTSRPTFQEADASEFRTTRPFDVVFSRFGVMFFEDPIAAFGNLAQALRSGGRLAFVCWRAITENPWVTVPLAAVLTVVPPPEPTPEDAPGPFAFADRTRVETILAAAGFTGTHVTPRDVLLRTGPLEDAVDYALLTGPAGRLAFAADGATLAKMRAAVREALRPYLTDTGVALSAAIWVVTAERK